MFKLGQSQFITVRKRSLGQGNIFRSVCQEFCPRGGGMLGYHTHRDQVPPMGPGTPWTRHSPGPGTPPPGPGTLRQSMLGDTVNEWVVRMRLECNLVANFIAVRKQSSRKVMFSQACVNNSVHGGMTPPSRQTPPADHRSHSRRLLQRTVRILLE